MGDLILGGEALERYLMSLRTRPVVPISERVTAYPALADSVMAGYAPGSSAHGEHPKFPVLLQEESGSRHVLVKFSPPRASAIGQRWGDLLVAEHLAHQHLAAHDIPASRSVILNVGDRTFLEVERFDRVGAEGRLGVVSLFALDASFYGRLDRWSACAARLAQDELPRAKGYRTDSIGGSLRCADRQYGTVISAISR